MSKLTNWLDNDDIDVQSIVDKYEKELLNQQNNNQVNHQHEFDNLEVWSEKLEDNEYRIEKPKNNKTISFDITNNIKDRDEEPIKIKHEKTINFDIANTQEEPIKQKPTTPPPPPPFKKPDLNNCMNKSSNVRPTPPPPPPPFKKPNFDVKENKNKTILFDENKFETKEKNLNQNCINFENVDTRILKNDEPTKTKKIRTNTIVFKNNTQELSQEEKYQEIKKQPLFNNESKQVNNKIDKTNSSFKKDRYFADTSSFEKILEENDYKTVKFQPIDQSEIIIEDNYQKKNRYENKCNKTNQFNDSLTKIFFNETKKAEELTKEINQADAFDIDVEKSKNKKKKRKASRENDEKNKYKTQVPKFIKNESKFLLIATIFTSILFLGSLGLIGYILYLYFNQHQSIYLLIPSGLLSLITLSFNILNLYRYKKLHKEIKDCNYEINKELPLISLKKIYKRLSIANINLNWSCSLIYTLSLLGILFTYIVTYFMNLINYQVNDFGYLIVNGDNTPFITMWSLAAIIFALIPIQIIFFSLNKHRMNNMNMYYQKEIIDDELIMKYQKQARKKWKIIYISIVAILGIVILITYLVLRRKSKK